MLQTSQAFSIAQNKQVGPYASIIIVNYNGGDRLEICLRSLLATAAAGTEIILVDNASNDGSRERVADLFPQVGLICSPENSGFGAGSNFGAHAASGEYLVFLNPDTVVTPGWLEALVSALKADPGVGLATSKILLMCDPERINTCGNDVHISGLTLCRGMGMDSGSLNRPEDVAAVSGAAFAIRNDLFQTLGGFDEDFFLYMEDTDLSLRARIAGWRCILAPASRVFHDYALRIGPRKIFYQERNRYQMLLKTLRWPTLLLLLPTLLLAEVVTWGFAIRQRGAGCAEKLQAYNWVLANWRLILSKRRRVQGLRHVADRTLLSNAGFCLAYGEAAPGTLARLAGLTFDPLFSVLRTLTLALLLW